VSPGTSPGHRGPTQLSTFVVNGYLFGAHMASVQEVVHHQPMTRVPLAPAAVSGLLNLRGQVVTAIDLRRQLGFPDRAAGEPVMDVILRTRHGSVCLLVDRIGDGVEVSEDAFEEPPETLRGVARELILGAYKLDGALLLRLDVERAVRPREDHGARAHP
jgi:purine-binding chemotaxis protein CheW